MNDSGDRSRLAVAALVLGVVALSVALFLAVASPNSAAYLGGVIAAGSTRQDPNLTVFTVTATGSASATPALAQIVFDVQTQSPNLSEALLLNDESSTKLLAALGSLGLGPSNITTLWFSVYPAYNTEPSPTVDLMVRQIFVVDNVLEVNMSARNLTLVGKAVETGVQVGGSQVESVSFTLSPAQSTKLEAQALGAALTNAQTQAEEVASQLGLKIVGVKSISEPYTYYPPYAPLYTPDAVGVASNNTVPPPQFYAGQTQYTVTVEVQYLLS